ncbi:nuclear transport factor 2 family protein [Ectothiorhodospiraceae bacterium WFHF3C12]|nr:nuclear transport factor 2 family protein [Ectothiorhodospiraceae bacterium WFHF3C12]
MQTPREIVDGYLEAVDRRDYPAVRRHLADEGFLYTSPINRFTSADELMGYIEYVTPIVQRREVRKVFADGDDVCHILVFTTQLSEKSSSDVAQLSEVRDGRIVRIQVIFDAYEYRMMFVPEDGAG